MSLKSILSTIICFSLIVFNSPKVLAQDAGGSNALVKETVGDLGIVLGTGAGGAILGLSTLSFSEEPTRHLRNIVVGAAVGIIAGVFIVAFKQASRSQDYLDASKEMRTFERLAWHKEKAPQLLPNQSQVGWTFTF